MHFRLPNAFMQVNRGNFVDALAAHQGSFRLSLGDEQMDRLADYYELVLEHNPLLHLVGPCSPEEFAVRHILESLILLEHLPPNARFADVGAGAGLPSIPCLLARDDLRCLVIESKERKAEFLRTAVSTLGLEGRSVVHNRQFAEVEAGGADFVTSRALDKFTERLPRLIRWARGRTLLLFGGDNMKAALGASGMAFREKLIPLSERRFLFIAQQ